MAGQLNCHFCGSRHKARVDKFPLTLYGERKVIDKETSRIVGKEKVIIGYADTKCARKARKAQRKELR